MNDWLDDAVRREGALMFSEHPESRILVLYADAAAELDAAERRSVDEHLRVCDACAEDLARLHAAAGELSGEEPAVAGPGLRGRLAQLLTPRLLVPALALTTVAVLLLGPGGGEDPLRPVGRAVVLRAEVERGAAPVAAPDVHGRVTLSFLLPDDGEGPMERCDVQVTDAAGRTVTRHADVPAFDAYGTFVLSLDASALPAGDYLLTARDRLGERSFAFTLERP
ncbi:zf-HC2 domain-containing protein [bacterium]|nr:zf-HC2 domain-containing protein [bacterium]HPF34295.1 zf-HC2 domain-containing protein [Candidatus Krumholzibacteria bacterium]HRX49926.1 zf-HC2 domain-containing protein [Candidatus Krumholzibacteria bacterium]